MRLIDTCNKLLDIIRKVNGGGTIRQVIVYDILVGLGIPVDTTALSSHDGGPGSQGNDHRIRATPKSC